jgi:hypothetical protein
LFDKHNVDVIVAWDTDVNTPIVCTKNIKFIRREEFPNFVPTKTSACRSAAVLEAYKIGYDIYIFLDDDVYPPKDGTDPIAQYIDGFQLTPHNSGTYDVGNFVKSYDNFLQKYYTRGFPYKDRHITPVVAQYGGWDNVADLDARDSRRLENEDLEFSREIKVIPKHQGFTGCFMNCAFKHEVVPCLFHLNMGVGRVGYDRFDDIWASLMLKRICDHMGWSILINGAASCYHNRASDNVKSVFQEQAGHKFNEDLWDRLLRVRLSVLN